MNYEGGDPQDTGQREGRYANYFEVGHNDIEFVLDFGQFFSDSEKVLHTRIITSPIYAKALLELLRDSLDRYERSFGVIPKEHKEKT